VGDSTSTTLTDEELRISPNSYSYIPPTRMSFNCDKEIGYLDFADQKLTFSGNLDESARIFFECLKNYIDPYMQNWCERNGYTKK
jgi:hypothetical protein